MRRLLIPVSLLFMFGTSIAQEVQQSNASFAAVPAEKGGQDVFGAYDIVENWPKDTAMSAGHEEWTFAAVRGVYAESPDRILAVQLG